MNVLIACEYSGRVRDAFLRRGHNAMSCDLLPTDAPGPHYTGDISDVIHGDWDILVAHPPCTYLSVSGMHWTVRGMRDPKLTEDALDFVRFIAKANRHIKRIAIENPRSVISTRIRPPDQKIQPYQFGHDASKDTWLWLKNLPPLKIDPAKQIEPRWVCCGSVLPDGVGKYGCPNCEGGKKPLPRWANQTDSGQNKLAPKKDRWKDRSETYLGIAEAMAEQWGAL